MNPIQLAAANPGPMTGEGNWTYLIGSTAPILIDAGVGKPSHLAAIAEAAPNGLSRVIVTHAHPDHVSGAPEMARRWPSASFEKYPWPDRDPALPWRWLADGDLIRTDEGVLQAVHTPGHAPDHLVLWHQESRTLFTGDMLVLGNSVVILASHGGDLAAYLASLQRMRDLNPARAYPAHGPVIDDPIGLIDRYLAHRAKREEQVLDALAQQRDTVEAIAADIYTGLIDALVPMARDGVLAHLQKLAREGRVVQVDERWRLAGPR